MLRRSVCVSAGSKLVVTARKQGPMKAPCTVVKDSGVRAVFAAARADRTGLPLGPHPDLFPELNAFLGESKRGPPGGLIMPSRRSAAKTAGLTVTVKADSPTAERQRSEALHVAEHVARAAATEQTQKQGSSLTRRARAVSKREQLLGMLHEISSSSGGEKKIVAAVDPREERRRKEQIAAFTRALSTVASSSSFPERLRETPNRRAYRGPRLLPYQENALAWMADREKYSTIYFPTKTQPKPNQGGSSSVDAEDPTLEKMGNSGPGKCFFWERVPWRSVHTARFATGAAQSHIYRHTATHIERLERPAWPRGGIVALSPGLGKTVLTMALLSRGVSRPSAEFIASQVKVRTVPKHQLTHVERHMRLLSKLPSTTLIVCPVSLLDHWRQHVLDCLPGFQVFVLHRDSLTQASSNALSCVATPPSEKPTVAEHAEASLDALRRLVRERHRIQNFEQGEVSAEARACRGVVVLTTYAMVRIALYDPRHSFHPILFPHLAPSSNDSASSSSSSVAAVAGGDDKKTQPALLLRSVGASLSRGKSNRLSDHEHAALVRLHDNLDAINSEIESDSAAHDAGTEEGGSREHFRAALYCAWDRVVLDEAQQIHNHHRKIFRGVHALRAGTRWCLTGTPLQNSLDDLYALIKFLDVDVWRERAYFSTFVTDRMLSEDMVGMQRLRRIMSRVCLRQDKDDVFGGRPLLTLPPLSVRIHRIALDPHERERYAAMETQAGAAFDELIAKTLAAVRAEMMKAQAVKGRGSGGAPAVASLVKGIVLTGLTLLLRLRQLSEDARLFDGKTLQIPQGASGRRMGMLPKRNESNPASEPVQLSAERARRELMASESTAEDIFEDADELEQTLADATASTTPASDGAVPATATATATRARQGSKCRFVAEFVREMMARSADEKCVIFSQWPSMLYLIQEALPPGVSVVFTGVSSSSQRTRTIERFNSNDTDPETGTTVRVLLVSLKAGGTGLNLSRANNCILVAPFWNPAVDIQAMMRVHRIGQTRPVTVVRLIARDTVEERVEELQRQKQSLADVAGVGRKLLGDAPAADDSVGSTRAVNSAGLTLMDLHALLSRRKSLASPSDE